MTRPISAAAATLALALLAAGPADAWSREGHMLTATIAYDDLMARDPAAAVAIAAIIDHHPDRGTFQVATAGVSADDRTLRLMMECARWPDDTRNTPFDHPTWHYADIAARGPGAPADLPTTVSGQSLEALNLNFKEAADPQAPIADRALALCWVMHLAGDVHQPLHTASLYSTAYPHGDLGGGLQFVRSPETKEVVSLHWYWDDRLNHGADALATATLAKTLETRFPRGQLSEIDAAHPADFVTWEAESHVLATEYAYPTTLVTSTTKDSGPTVPADYSKMVADISARRLALAGYRLAELLRLIAAAPPAKDAK